MPTGTTFVTTNQGSSSSPVPVQIITSTGEVMNLHQHQSPQHSSQGGQQQQIQIHHQGTPQQQVQVVHQGTHQQQVQVVQQQASPQKLVQQQQIRQVVQTTPTQQNIVQVHNNISFL